jgi:recombinational DNA repair ATPase RecF
MHIRRIHLREYKRFTELTVELPTPTRLVMMCGPNGSGKSSLLEAMKLWHDVHCNNLARGGDPVTTSRVNGADQVIGRTR